MKRPSTFVLPAALALTTFVALPACETGPSDEDAGVTTNASSGASSNSAGDTGGDSCFDLSDMAGCEADAMCNWDPDLGSCVPDCPTYETQEACDAAEVCAWDSIEGCLGPFT